VNNDQTVVGRLRIAAPDDGAIRSHAARILGSSLGAPSGLGSTALLCVRRFRDPRPGTLRLDPTTLSAPPEWVRAMGSSLEDALRHADRPIGGTVGAGSSAVLFADRSEVLACLARDWLGGTVRARWWWRSVEEARDPPRSIIAAFVERPDLVPGTLAHLARTGHAAALTSLLSAEEARVLSGLVGYAFGLRAVDRAVQALAVRAVGSSPSAAGRTAVQAPREREHAVAPWAQIVPEALAFIGRPDHELLIGVGLTLARAPSIARETTFDRDLRAWTSAVVRQGTLRTPSAQSRWTTVERRRPRTVAPPEIAIANTLPPATAPQQERGMVRRRAEVAAAPSAKARRPHPGTQPGSPPASQRRSSRPLAARGQDREAPVRETSWRPRRTEVVTPFRRTGTEMSPADEALGLEAPVLQAVPTRTRLGGAFYLLNVAQALGLYADFTQPMTPGIALDPWDFVALVARRLLADRDASDDPVWALLDELAGRPSGAQPGAGFRPPADWRIDPDWLVPFREDRRRWRWSASASGRRLVVRHPAGFPVVDISISDGAPDSVVRRALYSYRPHPPMRPEPGPPAPRRRNRVDRWVDPVAAYVAARLATALGVGRADRAIDLFLRHDADVFVTASAVDIQFSLDDLPIAIRVAGIDRDPGWFPAARRTIAFHFR
jgi:hypothetical protein